MTYDEMYPDAKEFEKPINTQGYYEDAVKGTTQLPCWNCQTMTYFVSVNFETPMCSLNCEKIKWDEYLLALKKQFGGF